MNFAFGLEELKQESIQVVTKKITEGVNRNSLIPITLFFMFISMSGIYMIKKVNFVIILNELNTKMLPTK